MTDELIERLRYTHKHGIFDAWAAGRGATMGEAADTLASQARQIEALREALILAERALSEGLDAIDAYNAENGTHLCGGALLSMAKILGTVRATLEETSRAN